MSREFVAPVRQRASFDAVASMRTGCAKRYHGNVDTGVIHE
jgi:hypothetical protein